MDAWPRCARPPARRGRSRRGLPRGGRSGARPGPGRGVLGPGRGVLFLPASKTGSGGEGPLGGRVAPAARRVAPPLVRGGEWGAEAGGAASAPRRLSGGAAHRWWLSNEVAGKKQGFFFFYPRARSFSQDVLALSVLVPGAAAFSEQTVPGGKNPSGTDAAAPSRWSLPLPSLILPAASRTRNLPDPRQIFVARRIFLSRSTSCLGAESTLQLSVCAGV